MKTDRRVFTRIFSILTILTVFMTFSCSGLFTSQAGKTGMGTLTIDLNGTQSRAAYTKDDVSSFRVTLVSEETGEISVPTKTFTEGTFSVDVPAGKHSLIIIGHVKHPTEENVFMPSFIGRENNITIKENETTSAEVTMCSFTPIIEARETNFKPEWDSGKLQQDLTAVGFTFAGWYLDRNYTQKVTEIPDTTGMTELTLYAHFTGGSYFPGGPGNSGRKAGDSKYFYVAQNARGDGKGLDADNAMAFSDMSLELMYFNQSNPDVIPEVIFITDVSFDFNHLGAVNITGKRNGEDGQRITITGTCTPVLSLAGNATDIIFDGKQSGTFQVEYGKTVTLDSCIIQNCTTGISNNGTLTLSDCTIQNCSNNYSESSLGAIDNSGFNAKLIIRDTSIENCSAGRGGAIMVGPDSELDVDGLSISGCSAENGGGIFIDGSQNVTLKNCTISYCTAAQNMNIDFHNQSFDGGGIYITSGKLTIGNNCSIKNCTAEGNGDSIYCTIKTLIVDPKPVVVNGTTWTSEYWIDDTVNAGSDFSQSSSLWKTAVPPYTPVAGEFFASQDGSGDGTTPYTPMAVSESFTKLAEYVSEHPGETPTLFLVSNVTLGGTVSCNVNIEGAGGSNQNTRVTIKGNSENIITFNSGVTCTVKNVSVDGDDTKNGINNGGHLTLDNCDIQYCNTGISNTGTLTLTNSNVCYCNTEGIHNTGTLTISSGSIDACGRGIYNSGTLTVKDYCELSNCNGNVNGRAIFQEGDSASMTVTNCEFSSCGSDISKEFKGGSIYIDVSNTNTNRILNCTFLSYSNEGGAIYHAGIGTLVLSGCTISDCQAVNGGGIYDAGPVNLINTTISQCNAGGKDQDGILRFAGRGGGIYAEADLEFGENNKIERCLAFTDANDVSEGKLLYCTEGITVNEYEISDASWINDQTEFPKDSVEEWEWITN